jgi:DNA-binding LacI/PurR family transcriptional regulator
MPEGDNELLIDKLHLLKTASVEAGFSWRFTPYRDPDEMHGLLAEVIASRPAGIVLKAAADPAVRRALARNRIPTVSYDGDLPGSDSVVLDRGHGVTEAVLRLLRSGRKRVLLLGSALRTERGAGYLAAHKAARATVHRSLVVGVPFGRDLYTYGYERCAATMDRLAFDAIAAVNDACAIGAIRALREAGRGVPEDVAVVGFDDIMVSRYTNPALTTVAQPIEQMAARAIALLVERIKGATGPRRVEKLRTSLVLRETA